MWMTLNNGEQQDFIGKVVWSDGNLNLVIMRSIALPHVVWQICPKITQWDGRWQCRGRATHGRIRYTSVRDADRGFRKIKRDPLAFVTELIL